MIVRGKIPGATSVVDIVIEKAKIVRMDPYREGSPSGRDVPLEVKGHNTKGDYLSGTHPGIGRGELHFGGTSFYVSSGFFDPQVNGFAGVDFNSPRLTPEGLHHVALSLASTGVTRFLPTLMTSSHERTVCQLKILADTIRQDPLFRKMCLGIHLEGPYISPEDGPRGAHLREFVRPPRWEELEKFQGACEGRIKLVTLAPELEGAIPFIERAVTHGIVIGVGHTQATEKDLERAVQAGVRLSCHLGNAPSARFPLYRNLIEKQLATDQLMASLIVDGIHLSPDVVRNYVRAKGINRIVLTTDSMAGAGASPGRYTLGDQEVEVTPDGAARSVTTSRLAGSTLTMDRAIVNVIRFSGVDLPSAIRMAAKNGRTLFPEVRGEIIPGDSANLVLFEYQKSLAVRSTWIEGEKVY